MLRMVKTLLLRQPTTFCVALMLSAREIGLENGRPLFVLDPLVPEPTPVSGDEDRDRCSPRLPFDEADLQFHIKTHTHTEKERKNVISVLSKEILSHVPCQLLRALIVSSDKNTTGTCLFYLLFLGDLFSPGKPDIYFRHALPFNKNEICKHAVTRMKVVHYFRQCP